MDKPISIYHSCLSLANVIYMTTLHFPKGMRYIEGGELRSICNKLAKDCLLFLRSRDYNFNSRVDEDLTQIEALVAVFNNVKVCVSRKGKQLRWDRLINGSAEVKIQELIAKIRSCL